MRRQGPLSPGPAPRAGSGPPALCCAGGGDGRRSRCEQGPEEGGPSVEEALVIAAPSPETEGGSRASRRSSWWGSATGQSRLSSVSEKLRIQFLVSVSFHGPARARVACRASWDPGSPQDRAVHELTAPVRGGQASGLPLRKVAVLSSEQPPGSPLRSSLVLVQPADWLQEPTLGLVHCAQEPEQQQHV